MRRTVETHHLCLKEFTQLASCLAVIFLKSVALDAAIEVDDSCAEAMHTCRSHLKPFSGETSPW
jgi:hypothetical protein